MSEAASDGKNDMAGADNHSPTVNKIGHLETRVREGDLFELPGSLVAGRPSCLGEKGALGGCLAIVGAVYRAREGANTAPERAKTAPESKNGRAPRGPAGLLSDNI